VVRAPVAPAERSWLVKHHQYEQDDSRPGETWNNVAGALVTLEISAAVANMLCLLC
jgi:hypothetical protein